jgi:hypothetical protein
MPITLTPQVQEQALQSIQKRFSNLSKTFQNENTKNDYQQKRSHNRNTLESKISKMSAALDNKEYQLKLLTAYMIEHGFVFNWDSLEQS